MAWTPGLETLAPGQPLKAIEHWQAAMNNVLAHAAGPTANPGAPTHDIITGGSIVTTETNQGLVLSPAAGGALQWRSPGLSYAQLQGVHGTTGQSAIILPNELDDRLGDFNQPTGEFTARFDGLVRVTIWGRFSYGVGAGSARLVLQKDPLGVGSYADVAEIVAPIASGVGVDIYGYQYTEAVTATDKLRLYQSIASGIAWSMGGVSGGYLGGSLPLIQWESV